VIFVHGCFWHRHPDPQWNLARLPKSGLDFWLPKLETNRKRDQRNSGLLTDLGWDILVIWECQTKESERLAAEIKGFLK
jgi:DNA mismatch endonuclease (patch repair protein)